MGAEVGARRSSQVRRRSGAEDPVCTTLRGIDTIRDTAESVLRLDLIMIQRRISYVSVRPWDSAG